MLSFVPLVKRTSLDIFRINDATHITANNFKSATRKQAKEKKLGMQNVKPQKLITPCGIQMHRYNF